MEDDGSNGEEDKAASQTPVSGRRISFSPQNHDRNSSPVATSRNKNDSLNRSRMSKHKSQNDLLNGTSSLQTYLTKVDEGSQIN